MNDKLGPPHPETGQTLPEEDTVDRSYESRLDRSVAHPARRYDYWLGGKDNYAADRESGDAIEEIFPTIRITVRENRRVLNRMVRYLAAEAGIRQFLDIGTGIPTAENTHEVAQGIAPDSRIVYVDNDPIVLTHARALLTSTKEGASAYIEADLRDPIRILESPELQDTLDLQKPVALMLIAILHFFGDDEDPRGIVKDLMDQLPSGSYLAATHATYDHVSPEQQERALEVWAQTPPPRNLGRSHREFSRFFDGLVLVEPGVVDIGAWRPDKDTARIDPAIVSLYGGVARKP